MWILIIIFFALCIYKIIDATREAQELRRETQRLQEDAGRRQTQAQEDHRKVQALEDNAKELQDGLEAVSSRSKAKDAVIASLEARLVALHDEKKQLAKAKDQATLDAKRALSSIHSSGKGARDAIRQKEMAEEDRDIAYKQMEEAQETAARAEAAAVEAIEERDRVLALKASVDAQAVENDRIRADLHAAHEAQTKAEADRCAAQQLAATSQTECAAARTALAEAEAARDAAVEAQKAAEQALDAVKQELKENESSLAEALARATAAETAREREVAVWKLRATEAEKAREAEEDRMVETQKQVLRMQEKFKEVLAGNTATLEQVDILQKQVDLSETEIDNLRNQLKKEIAKTGEAQTKLEEAVKEQQRLEIELIAAEEAAVQSAEEEIISVRRDLEARVAEFDGEIKSLKAQLEAATLAANSAADADAERLQEAEEELEKFKMFLQEATQEQDRLQIAVTTAENELESVRKQLEEAQNAQISAAVDKKLVVELKEEIQLENSRRQEVEEKLESLKMELEKALDARDSARTEVERLRNAVAAAEVEAKASAATKSDSTNLLEEELAVLKKKMEGHEVEIAALLDAKTSLDIKLEEEKKITSNLRELNTRILLSRKQGAKETIATTATTSGSGGGGVGNSPAEKGLQSPAVIKASSDMAEKLDKLKKSTDKLKTHRSPGSTSSTPPQSPLLTKTP